MEIFVVAEDDRRALPRREREQRRAHRFVRGDVSVGVAVAELGGPAFEVGALDRAAPEEVRGQVDDRSAEVAVERLGVAQVVEAAHESKERFLDEILGERPVARQEVGEPEPGRGRPLVDLGQPARARLLGSHVGDHRRPLRTHITGTYEDPKVLRSRAVGVLRI